MTDDEVTRQRTTLFHNRTELLAESYVQGRELTVGIIDGVALPIVEIIPPSDLQTYDFEAKYERVDTQFIKAFKQALGVRFSFADLGVSYHRID